jgi:hypothetical protein
MAANTFGTLQFKYQSLMVRVSDATLNDPTPRPNRSLLVHETQSAGGLYQYGMYVDDVGVSINSAPPNRSTDKYALIVDGDVKVTGRIVGAGALPNNPPPWQMVANSTHAFFTGVAMMGKGASAVALANTNTLLIYQTALTDIDNAQFSIENTYASKFNIGILGDDADAPAIIHTNGAPIEFHVGRTQDGYFSTIYTGFGQLPRYDGTPANAPHMVIDAEGNVGIHTSACPTVTWNKRQATQNNRGVVVASSVETTTPMDLYVAGTMFASNVLVHDPDTGKARDLSDLFTRVQGTTFPAASVLSGTFSPGDFVFPDRLAIDASIDQNYSLTVGGSVHIASNLVVNGDLNSDALTVANEASIYGELQVYQDLLLHQTLRLHNGLAVAQGPSENGQLEWKNVQFTLAGSEASNINMFGAGATTPGQFGCGIAANDAFDSQFAVFNRRNLTWEAQLRSLNNPNFTKVAFLGHPNTVSRMEDGSFIITTPATNDPAFVAGGGANAAEQNIYLYPGSYTAAANALPILRDTNPPVLGAFSPLPSSQRGRVGINTFSPKAELHVTGDLAITGQYLTYDPSLDRLTPLATWTRIDYHAPDFAGMRYFDPAAPHVGINANPSINYGAVIAGGLKVIGGTYIAGTCTADDEEVAHWVRPTQNMANNFPCAVFRPVYSHGPVGIGVVNPLYPLEINNVTSSSAQGTYVRLHASAVSPLVGLQFNGPDMNWRFHADTSDAQRCVELYLDKFPSVLQSAATSNSRALRVRYNSVAQKYLVEVGMDGARNYASLYASQTLNPLAALTVGGDLNVAGDIWLTGNIYQNRVLASSNAAMGLGLVATPRSSENVYIGGEHVHLFLTPSAAGEKRGFVSVGYPDDSSLGDANASTVTNAVLRVYQSFNATIPSVMRLESKNSRCYMEFVNGRGNVLYIGINESGQFVANTVSAESVQQDFFAFGETTDAQMGTGFGTSAPEAKVHIQGATSNLLRVTRQLSTAQGGTGGALQLETIAGSSSKMWQVTGPDSAFFDKLTFSYAASNNATPWEALTLTSNGRLGIGNSNPQYALDVAASTNNMGGLRLYSHDANPQPQLIFQSGNDPNFGVDASSDYRMYAQSNQFVFEGSRTSTSKTLMHFGINNTMGVGGAADDAFPLKVHGLINAQGYAVNGAALFSVSDDAQALDITWQNIYLRPKDGGGIVVNKVLSGTGATGNLFHIFSGQSANMMVYESAHASAQVHYRVAYPGSPARHAITREAMTATASASGFAWQHYDGYNAANDLTDYTILDTDAGWSNVFGWSTQPTGKFAFDMAGSLTVDASVAFGGSATLTGAGGALRVAATNGVGVGVAAAPQGALHVVATNTAFHGALVVEATGVPLAVFGAQAIVFAASGAATFACNVNIENAALGNGAAQLPSLAFAASPSTGMWRPAPDALAVSTAGAERLRVTADGSVGIGTASPLARLHAASASGAACALFETGAGDGNALEARAAGATALVVRPSGAVGVGTAAPAAPLHVDVQYLFSRVGTFSSNVTMNQDCLVQGNVIAAGQALAQSDRRLKTDLARIDGALDKVAQLSGYTFTRIDTGVRGTGLVAQEVEAVLPEAVGRSALTDDVLSIAYGQLAGLFVEAIKELRGEVAELRAAIRDR